MRLGWGALTWTETRREDPCRLERHPVLRHLSKKTCKFPSLVQRISVYMFTSSITAIRLERYWRSFYSGTLRNCTPLKLAEPSASNAGYGRVSSFFENLKSEVQYILAHLFQNEGTLAATERSLYSFLLLKLSPLSQLQKMYCQVRLLFAMSVKVDTVQDPIEMNSAFIVCKKNSLGRLGWNAGSLPY